MSAKVQTACRNADAAHVQCWSPMSVAESSSCALCGQLPTPVLRESRFWRTVINRNQTLLGKLMIVLLRHEETVAELTADEWRDLHSEVRWATGRLREAFAPDHFNYAFLQNQDRHVHLHVIPRYQSPRWLAGTEFKDADYPDHYRVPGARVMADKATLDAIADALASG